MKSKVQKVHNRKEMKAKTPRRWYKHKDGDSEEGLDYLFTGEVIREAEAGGTEDTCESQSAQDTGNDELPKQNGKWMNNNLTKYKETIKTPNRECLKLKRM